VHEHNHTKRGAKSLRGQRPVKLMWKSSYFTKGMALKLERKLKDLSRSGKEKFLNNKLPIYVEERCIICPSILRTSSS
jgi:predicted GIY-YIG superfamily endonuclease